MDGSFAVFPAETAESLAEKFDLLVITGDQYSEELSLTAKESAGQYEHVLFGIEKRTEIVDCSDLLIK
jgi:hypothetical protein